MSAIPQSILDVKRPANTAVLDTHTDSNRRYVVRRRATSEELAAKPGVKYKETVGYIIGGSFVAREAKQENSGQKSVTVSYGAAALVLMFALVVFKDLKKVFSCLDAMLYTVLATLKVLHPNVTAHTMKRLYERDFTSIVFPHMRLSENKVGETYRNLGLNAEGRKSYFDLQLQKVQEHGLLYVDGSLIQDTSTVNSLSAASYKKKQNGHNVRSVIFAMSANKTFCCEDVFAGSMSDTAAFKEYLSNNQIEKGIICADAGFCPSTIKNYIQKNGLKKLHYILHIKKNDKRIKEQNLLDVDEVFVAKNGYVLYKKVKVSNSEYIYAFKNSVIEHKQNQFALKKLNQKKITQKEYNKLKKYFGFIFIISDLDLSPEFVYKTVLKRWDIEVLFEAMKRTLGLDITRVEDDYEVIGQAFIDMLSVNIYSMVFSFLKEKGFLKHDSFCDIMEDLKVAWRNISPEERTAISQNPSYFLEEGMPVSDDHSFVHTSERILNMLVGLGLCKKGESQNSEGKWQKSKVTSEKKEEKSVINFEAIFLSLTDLFSSKRNLRLLFSERNVSILLSFLATIIGIVEMLAERIYAATNCAQDLSESTNPDKERSGRGRKKGSLNKKTEEKFQSLKKVANALISIKEGCQTAVAEIGTYESLSAKSVRDNSDSSSKSRANDEEQEAATNKPGSHQKKKASKTESEQTSADARDNAEPPSASDVFAETSVDASASGSVATGDRAGETAKQSVANSRSARPWNSSEPNVSSEASTDACAARSASTESNTASITETSKNTSASSKSKNAGEKQTAPKKPGVPVGTKRPDFNKDGSPRQKPGPKPGSHHKKKETKAEAELKTADSQEECSSQTGPTADVAAAVYENTGATIALATEGSVESAKPGSPAPNKSDKVGPKKSSTPNDR